MSTPSSTNTTAASGLQRGDDPEHLRSMRSRTSASLVNSAASHGREHHHRQRRTARPTTMPDSIDAARHDAGIVRARRAEEPADHRLRRDRQRVERQGEQEQDLHAIWCAATSSSLMRDAMAVAVSERDQRARRCARRAGSRRSRSRWMPAGARSDRRALAGERRARRSTRYATAAPYCAITVPHAEPAMPRSSPYTRSSSSSRFTALAATAMTSVVRVSCMPRR